MNCSIPIETAIAVAQAIGSGTADQRFGQILDHPAIFIDLEKAAKEHQGEPIGQQAFDALRIYMEYSLDAKHAYERLILPPQPARPTNPPDFSKPPSDCPTCHGQREWNGQGASAICHSCGNVSDGRGSTAPARVKVLERTSWDDLPPLHDTLG